MQWFELTAAMVLGWAGYLRCQDIINLQLCDVTWEEVAGSKIFSSFCETAATAHNRRYL